MPQRISGNALLMIMLRQKNYKIDQVTISGIDSDSIDFWMSSM